MNEIRYYRFGSLTVSLDGPSFSETPELAAFRTASCDADERFTVTVAEHPEPFVSKPLHTELNRRWYPEGINLFDDDLTQLVLSCADFPDGTHSAVLNRAYLSRYGTKLVLQLLDLPHRALEKQSVFLHASFILWKQHAILFTAPCGTGKSTQAALWQRFAGAEIINGDRAFLQMSDDGIFAAGTPYCGSSGICRSDTAPVLAVVILGQAPENSLTVANLRETFAAMLDGCSYWTDSRQHIRVVTDMAEHLYRCVPVYRLDCLPDESAVQLLKEELCKLIPITE